MDWSLVLLSQGIESTVVYGEGGWQVLVAGAELDRARAIIAQYRSENRGWFWRQRLRWPREPFHWGVLAWCAVVAFFYTWSVTSLAPVRESGVMSSAAVRSGEWWRLFTGISLHADLSHLAGNLTIGFIVLGLGIGRWGPGCALLAAWLGGAVGNALGLVFYAENHRGLGASGMVMAGLGLLAAASLHGWRHHFQPSKWVVRSLLGGVLLFVLLGLDPASDVLAHLGGFAAGTVLGAGLAAVPERFLHHPAVNVVSSGVLIGMVILTWAFALH